MLKKLVLKPGINKEGTNYANEDGFYSCDKIRFRSGYAEKIGGWQNINGGTYTYEGVARTLDAWASLTGEKIIGVGTSQKFYIEYDNKYNDITPIYSVKPLTANIAVTTNIKAITIAVANHGAPTGTFFTLTRGYGYLSSNITDLTTSIVVKNVLGTFPASGVIRVDNELMLYGSYIAVGTTYTFAISSRGYGGTTPAAHSSETMFVSMQAIPLGGIELVYDSTTYTPVEWQVILDGDVAGNDPLNKVTTNTISPTTSAGVTAGTIYAIIKVPAGEGNVAVSAGWGTGTWGSNPWGAGQLTTAAAPLRLWSQSNYDEDLVFAYRNGPIYWWTKNLITYPAATTLAAQTSKQVKITTTATWVSGNSYITVTDSSRINTGSLVTSATAGIPDGTYVGTSYTFGNDVPLVNAAGATVTVTTTQAAPVDVSFSFAGEHVPKKTLFVAISSSNAFTIAFGATPYNPYDFNSTFDPLLVRWSDQDNPYEWVPEITNQSGEQRLANGSTIVTSVNTRQEILIWTDTAIYSMQYLGPPYVFGINLLMDNLSIASPTSAITVNSVTYWMGADRFYQYSGRVETLPCTLRQFIFGRINKAEMGQVICGTNEGFNEIWWFYPSGSSTINNSYVVFNHLENIWYYGDITRTAWLDTQLNQYPLGAFSTVRMYLPASLNTTTTYIQLNSTKTLPDSGIILIDSEQISYTSNDRDQGILSGGSRGVNSTTAATHLQFSRVSLTTPNQLMYHELGYDDVSNATPAPIAAYVESSDFDLEDGMNFAYVWRIIPDLTFDGSTSPSPQCELTVKVRQNSGAAYTPHSTDTQTVYRTATYPVEQFTGQVYTRVRGRQMAFRMESSELGVFWQMGLMRIDIKPDGRR